MCPKNAEPGLSRPPQKNRRARFIVATANLLAERYHNTKVRIILLSRIIMATADQTHTPAAARFSQRSPSGSAACKLSAADAPNRPSGASENQRSVLLPVDD